MHPDTFDMSSWVISNSSLKFLIFSIFINLSKKIISFLLFIASNAKVCPNCGAKNKKPFYKAVWFWVIVVIVIIAAAGGGSGESSNEETKFEKNKGTKVTVVDMSGMTEAERDTWCNEKK